MINLRALANTTIQSINPNISVTWVQANGYTTNADFSRTPTTIITTVQANVQGLSGRDLQHVEGLNIQGVMRSVHLYGNVQGVVRADQKGGDILQFPEVPGGPVKDWRVISVMETWPTWARVLVCLQST